MTIKYHWNDCAGYFVFCVVDSLLISNNYGLIAAFKYDDVNNQKRIMRLELGAEAVVKKDMTSRGAFAMLQGLHMKYYVKKPEVFLFFIYEIKKIVSQLNFISHD